MKLKDLYNRYSCGRIAKQEYIDIMHERHQALFDYSDYIRETNIESITINNDSVVVAIKGNQVRFLLDKGDRRFMPFEALNFKAIDAEEKKLLFKLAHPSKAIFDIGANIGWYTISFAKLSRAKKIYAFEPIPYTFGYLKKHIKLNQVNNVLAFNFGFSDTAEDKTFYWAKNEGVSASIKNIQERHRISKIKCRVTTIDKFTKPRKAAVDLIKCDVEGAELFVLRGAVETLRKYKPIIYVEMLRKWAKQFGYHPDSTINLLADLGYSCYGYINNKIEKISNVASDLETTNFFFFHETKHKKLMKRAL